MKLFKKTLIFSLLFIIILVLTINFITTSRSLSVTAKHLDIIKNTDWSTANLENMGFAIDDSIATLTINSSASDICRITVTKNITDKKTVKEYDGIKYSAHRNQNGVFDFRKYKNPYSSDYYVFIYGDICIEVSEHLTEKDNSIFFSFLKQIESGQGDISFYESGFGKIKK